MTKWFYRIQGKPFGPVSFDGLIQLAMKGAIQPDTLVRRESQNWMLAKDVPGIFDQTEVQDEPMPSGIRVTGGSFVEDNEVQFEQISIDMAQPGGDRDSPSSAQHVATSMNTASSSSRFREAFGLSEMFETSFDVYVTPLIVRAIWLFNLLFSALLLVAAIIAVFRLPFESSVATNLEIAKRCCGILALMLFLFFELLSLRLGLEMAIVFFNVSLSLQSIDKKTKA